MLQVKYLSLKTEPEEKERSLPETCSSVSEPYFGSPKTVHNKKAETKMWVLRHKAENWSRNLKNALVYKVSLI